jgi:hypothetical protein
VPLSLTHAVFELEDKQILVVDPTSEEQDVAASLITVTVMTKPKAETYAQIVRISPVWFFLVSPCHDFPRQWDSRGASQVVMDASELGAKGAGASAAAKEGKVCVLKQGGAALPQDKIRAAAQNARSRAEKVI